MSAVSPFRLGYFTWDTFLNVEHVNWLQCITWGRPRRWIVTIPSLDQWLATIGNHWKTIVSNEKTIEKPSVPMVCQTQNHWKTIVSKGKTIEKPLVPMVGQTKTIEKPSLPMVCQTKNHWYRWLLSNHSFKGTSEYENLGVLQLKSQ